MNNPNQPVLSFQNITYRIPSVPKPILDDISGYIPLGKLTAIYGPSGSGKTTLLNTLSFHLDDIKNSTLSG